MSQIRFRIERATFDKISERWTVQGRAHADVSVGDMLVLSPDAERSFRVEQIVTYGKSTDLLSRVMTGTLILSGGSEDSPFPKDCSLHKSPHGSV